MKFTAGRKWPEDVYPTIFAISVVIGCLYAVAQAGLQHSAATAAAAADSSAASAARGKIHFRQSLGSAYEMRNFLSSAMPVEG